MDVPEREERTQLELRLGRRRHQFVLYEQLVFVGHEEDALAEDNLAHLVGDGRDRIGVEVDDILVPAWLVDVAVAVDAEVELLAFHDERFVEGGKKHVLVAPETVQRDGEQTMIAAGIASDDACVAIGACLVRADDLPLQRVRQIHQLRFVELEKCHIL